MNEAYLIPIILAAVIALAACDKKTDSESVHPEPPFPSLAELPPLPKDPASIPTLPTVTVKASTPVQPVTTVTTATPSTLEVKPKIDLTVFSKRYQDCLLTTHSTKLTVDQCREKAWKEAGQ